MNVQRRAVVLLIFCALSLPVVALHAQEDPVALVLRQNLEGAEGGTAITVGSRRLSSPSIIRKIYERREYLPFWNSYDAVSQFVEAIEDSYREGLNPRDYHLKEIRGLLGDNPEEGIADPALAASLELLLTDAFILLARHSTCGWENPATHYPQWSLDRLMGNEDPVEYFEKRLADPSIRETVDTWKVHDPYYESLKKALARYRDIRSKGGWRKIPEGMVMKKGNSGPWVAALRRRLEIEDPELGPAPNPQLYDADLHRAVRRFQSQHGIRQDGVAARETLAAMNVPVEYRIEQIRINLERCRWVLKDLDNTFVMVDIVGFRVSFQKQGRIVWSGRAQVGKPFRDTPVVRSEITHLEVNPTWTIPPTILTEDVLPDVSKDLGYLDRHNIEVIDRLQNVTVRPRDVDWSLFTEEPPPYKLVQKAGPANPLGRIKFMFPNEQRVFLHDTPEKALFDRAERTFSSGCIRIERPFELAALLMGKDRGWTQEKLMRAVATGKTWKVYLPQPVPVLLMYATVTIGDRGRVFFRKDLYSRDIVMMEGLGNDPVQVRPGSI